MAKTAAHAAAPPAARSSGRRFITKGAIISFVLLIPVGALTLNLFRTWWATRSAANKQDAEFRTLAARNAVLGKAYEVLQNKKFTVCNKSAYPLVVSWVSAAYNDGKQVKLFDSSKCTAWQPIQIESGENKVLFLSSSQEGCNWSGNVMYFAMRFTKETEEASLPFNITDMWRSNWDRGCYNVP